MHHHHDDADDHVDEAAVRTWPVPAGFVSALSDALHRTMPHGIVSSMAMWEGKERIAINFRDVSDQEQVLDAVSEALNAIDTQFDYFPGIDISIWKH